MAEHKYDRGGGDTDDDGTVTIEPGRFYGEDKVWIALEGGASSAYLTADQARAVARDLIEHADRLDLAETDG